MQSARIKELDALRGIAALMVVFFHYTFWRPQAKLGFNLGTTGVDLFFMISGFVIFMSLLHVKNSKEFIINRVSRLYPAYWACVTFTFIVLSLYRHSGFPKENMIQYAGNMSMFQYYLSIPDMDDSYWTMIIEMIFYILMLAAFHFKKLHYITVTGITLIVLVTGMGCFFYDKTWVKELLKWVPLLHYLSLFLAGIIFYRIYTNQSKRLVNYSLLLVCLIAQMLTFTYSERFGSAITYNEYKVMLCAYFLVFTFFVNGKLRFLVSKLTLFFGSISFTLYLVHQAFSKEILLPWFLEKLYFPFWPAAFCSLAIVVVVATLITYFIEIPLRKKLKEKLLAKKNQ
jgi:peptidoglycan/LPS O-acetylase OafA/YrhL